MLVDELAASGWLAGRRVQIIPNPIDLQNWDSLPPVSMTRPMVLAVGRLEALKPPEVLVRAVATLADDVPEIELVFI